MNQTWEAFDEAMVTGSKARILLLRERSIIATTTGGVPKVVANMSKASQGSSFPDSRWAP